MQSENVVPAGDSAVKLLIHMIDKLPLRERKRVLKRIEKALAKMPYFTAPRRWWC